MLIDPHAHSSGISTCCLVPYSEVIDTAKKNGIDGIVLTNHYSKKFMSDGDPVAFSKRYVEEYRKAKEYASAVGVRIFFGIEVTMKLHQNAHLLVYGVDEDFVLSHPTMNMYTQEELYGLVREAGGALIQAHPYRKKDKLLDVSLLDGVELSCHPKYEGTYRDELVKVAEEAGIILTCGGDYHADTYRPLCGIYLDESIDSGSAFARYLRTAGEVTLCVHEVGDDAPYDFVFRRRRGEGNT